MQPYRAWPFLSDPHHPVLSAVWAVLIHGAISVSVLLPILLVTRRRVLMATLAFISGPAFDLDHVVAALSVSPRALEHLHHRPDTHSLAFAFALTLVTWLVTRKRVLAWSVLAVLVAHLLFDAAGGATLYLYPLTAPSGIPWLICPIGLLLLAGGSWMLAGAQLRAGRSAGRHPPAHLGGAAPAGSDRA